MSGTPESQTQTMIDNIPAKTGKTLPEWLAIVSASGLEKHGQIIRLLTDDHGLSYGFANLIATLYLQQQHGGPQAGDDLIAAQYSGDRSGLKPIFDSILAAVQDFGPDVEIAPKKAYVSLRRNKQFAIVQPSTKTRLDIGLNLKNTASTNRLAEGNIFNGMCTHLVKVSSNEEIDSELLGWLKLAYDQA